MTSSDRPSPASPASDVVVRNPYRVLGLSGDTSWSEIQSAARRLRDAPEPGTESTPWDLPWLGPVPRTEADVERALARLADPNRRIHDRLFWFHERVAESAVYELNPTTIRDALEGWSATSQPLARHDAAVVALLAAITLDPDVKKSSLWRRAVNEWEEALALEPYWLDVLRLEMEGGFENPASLADVREVRERGTRLVTEPLLAYAREAVIAEDLPRAARILAVLREVLPEDVFANRCGDLAEHVWGSFDADWNADARGKPPEPAEDAATRLTSLETQNPALWDFAAVQTDDSVPDGPVPPDDRAVAEGSGVADSPETIDTPRADDAGDPAPPAAPRDETASRTPPTPAAEDASGAPVPEAPPTPTPPRRDPGEETGSAGPAGTRSTAPEPTRAEPTRAEPAAAEPARSGPRDRPRAGPRAPRWRRLGPIALIAVVASLVIVTLAIFLSRPRPGAEAGATPADATVLRGVERRMDTIDAALAQALLERNEIDEEIELARESVEGYQTLVEDYERRIARRLPADRSAYRRVVGLRDEARSRLDAVLADRRAVEERIDRLERIGSSLVAEWNAVGASRRGATERLPSP